MIDKLNQTKIKMIDIVDGIDNEAEKAFVMLNDLDSDLFSIPDDEKCSVGSYLEICNGRVKNNIAQACVANIRKNCKSAIESINTAFDKLDAELVKSNVIELDPDESDVQAANIEVKVIKF